MPWSSGYVVALVLDGGDQAAAVGERLVDLHGDRPGVDVDPRRGHAGQGASAPSIECLQWSQWISGTLMVIVVIWSLRPRWQRVLAVVC